MLCPVSAPVVEGRLKVGPPAPGRVHDKNGTVLVQPKYAMSFMRGPLSPIELQGFARSETQVAIALT